MNEIRTAAVAVRSSGEEVDDAVSHFLAVMRTAQPFEVLHASLVGVSEALQASTRANRALAEVLALDPDKLAGDEPLVSPIIDHVD